ncbi:SUMO ligase siz1 [Tulasnella sp. 332]|nr:SUMO ligase siz1 [Tulasnella sp. 332]
MLRKPPVNVRPHVDPPTVCFPIGPRDNVLTTLSALLHSSSPSPVKALSDMGDQSLSTLVAELKRRIADHTVDRLKGIIQGFNEHCGGQISRTGKKAELQDKLRQQLDIWEVGQSVASITTAKTVLDHIDSNGSYNHVTLVQSLHAAPSPIIRLPPIIPPPASAANGTYANGHANGNGAGPSNAHLVVPAIAPKLGQTGIGFKPSPFFHIEQHVSLVTTCPESAHMHDRKIVSFEFSLTADQRERLQSEPNKYQLRVYCTSSAFYNAPTPFRPSPSNVDAPIEFPNTCELRVNNVNLHAQTKGLKKKPGTAPPANLGTAVRLNASATNRVEMVYCNNNPIQGQAPNNRKYFLQVNLVKVTMVQELVDRLRKGKYRSREAVLASMKESNQYDDDIVAGPQKISLKCPISYTRIDTPSRSSKCVHASCFDAQSWYSMMEITSTWQCPICENALDLEDVIVDGYFDEILKITHEDVEEVFVEADGEWHSPDDKYHSAGWIPPIKPDPTSHHNHNHHRDTSSVSSTAKNLTPLLDRAKITDDDVVRKLSNGNIGGGGTAEEIILDSDDDDYDDVARVRREIIPVSSSSPGTRTSQQTRGGTTAGGSDEVIDLTLDSDDESELPLPTVISSTSTGKRKERSMSSSDEGDGPLALGYHNKRSRLVLSPAAPDMRYGEQRITPPPPPQRHSNGFSSYAPSSAYNGGDGSRSSNGNGIPSVHSGRTAIPPSSSFVVRHQMSAHHVPPPLHVPGSYHSNGYSGARSGGGFASPVSFGGSSTGGLSPPPMGGRLIPPSTPALPSRPGWGSAVPPSPPAPPTRADYHREQYPRQW